MTEESRMISMLQQGANEGPKLSVEEMLQKRAHIFDKRPTGSIFYIMRMEWCLDENVRQTPQELLNVAPAPWEDVRYFLEQRLGILRACKMGSYLKALVVTDFDTRNLKAFPALSDPHEIVAPQSVIVVSRLPRPKGLPVYVPNHWVEDFQTWRYFDRRDQARKRSRGTTRVEAFVSRIHLYLPTGKRVSGTGDWGHASEFVGPHKRAIPGGLMCHKCRLMGYHLEADCPNRNANDDPLEIPMEAKKLVRGIPRSSMRLLADGSHEAKYATLRDETGNCYEMKRKTLPGPSEVPRADERRPPVAERCSPAAERCPPVAERCPAERRPPAAERRPPVAERCPAERRPPAAERRPPVAERCPPVAERRPAERRPPVAERCPPVAERRPAERRPPAAERRPAERRPPAAERHPPAAERRPPAAERRPERRPKRFSRIYSPSRGSPSNRPRKLHASTQNQHAGKFALQFIHKQRRW
jgi:hypothetical protein